MMDSSEKSGNWLMHITELHERITKLTPAFTWLFWILLGISITIAYLSLAFPTLLVNSYFCSYLCSQATFSFAIKVIWRYHFFSNLWKKPSPDHLHSSTGIHNPLALLKWDKAKADNIDFLDIWILNEVQNQVHRRTNASFFFI